MERRRVVITGLGAVTPIGLTAEESWQAVRKGVCGVAPITQFDTAGQKVTLAAEVKGFDPDALLGRQAARHMGRFTQFAVAAARQALADAGFDAARADPDRCGVIVSSGIGGDWKRAGAGCLRSMSPPPSATWRRARWPLTPGSGECAPALSPPAPGAPTPWATPSITSGTATQT